VAAFFCLSTSADLFVGEIEKKECRRIQKKTYFQYLSEAKSKAAYEVNEESESPCGRLAHIRKKKNRHRWSAFLDEKSCKCYLSLAERLAPEGKTP